MAKHADIIRLQNDGFNVKEIADLLGITPQRVYYLRNPESNAKRLSYLEKKRRLNGQGTYECGICGQRGHNARRHRRDD